MGWVFRLLGISMVKYHFTLDTFHRFVCYYVEKVYIRCSTNPLVGYGSPVGPVT